MFFLLQVLIQNDEAAEDSKKKSMTFLFMENKTTI